MSERKPQILDSTKVGTLAVTYIQTIFEEYGWVFRRADGSTDYGVDAEIELIDNNKVTGKIFKCQIKGTQSIDFDKEFSTVRVNVTTWNNWKDINLPVIVLLCNIETKEVYWALPLGTEPKKDSDSVTLRFYKEHCLNRGFIEFQSVIDSWLENFPKKNILREIPFFHNLFFKDLEPLIDWGDPWCSVEEEYNMKARVFYSHVLELRASLGLRNDVIFPFDYWLIRNQGMWDDPQDLYHATISELIFYIKFYYEEALNKLDKRLAKVEPCFENNEIINYFKLHPLQETYKIHSVVYTHPLGNYDGFHKSIEKSLTMMGYGLRYKWRAK